MRLWQFLGVRTREEFELARRFSRRGPAAPIRQTELPSPQRQDHTGVAEGEGDGIAVAGHHDALAYVPADNGPVGHESASLVLRGYYRSRSRDLRSIPSGGPQI